MKAGKREKINNLSLRIIGLFMVITLLCGSLLPVGVMATEGDYEILGEGTQEDFVSTGPDETAEDAESQDEFLDNQWDVQPMMLSEGESEEEPAGDSEENTDETTDETSEDNADANTDETSEDNADVNTDETSEDNADVNTDETSEDNADANTDETSEDNADANADETSEDNADVNTDETSEDDADANTDETSEDNADVNTDVTPEDETTGEIIVDDVVLDEETEEEPEQDEEQSWTTFFEALSEKAAATAEILGIFTESEEVKTVLETLTGVVLKITEQAVEDISKLFVNYYGEEIQNYATFDLGFYFGDEEVEPGTEVAVTVDLTKYLADQDYIPESLVLYHHVENEWGEIVDTVQVASYEDDGITVDEDGTVTAAFTVNSFSDFTVVWDNNEEVVYYCEGGEDHVHTEECLIAPQEKTPYDEVYETVVSVADAILEEVYLMTEDTSDEEMYSAYERMGLLYDEVYAAYDEGTITDEECETLVAELDVRFEELLSVLGGFGFDPYGTVMLPADDAVTYDLNSDGTFDTVTADPAPGVSVTMYNYSSEFNDQEYSIVDSGYKFYNTGGVNIWNPEDSKETVDDESKATSGSYSSWNSPKRLPFLPLYSSLDAGYPNSSIGSLKPLFDGNGIGDFSDADSAPGKVVYPTMSDGGGLFQKDADGYYVYDSAENAAYFNPTANGGKGQFTLYKDTTIRPSYNPGDRIEERIRDGNFLPFNEVTSATVHDEDDDDNNYNRQYGNVTSYRLKAPVDLWFGMVIEFEFLMPKDGLINGEPMEFEFHGDDDVMVYIDDQLVLDISGAHYAESGTIDFVKGEATVVGTDSNGNTPNNLTVTKNFSDIFKIEDEDDKKLYNEDGTFKDYTVHTLKFFYLERGGTISYCRLRFNMPTLPKNSITVGKELTVDNNTNVKVEDILKDTLTYKFRVVKSTDTNPLTTNDNTVLTSGKYIVYMDGNAGDYETRELGADGIISLKSGQRASFEDILNSIGKDQNYFVEELIPTDIDGQYEGVQVVGQPEDITGYTVTPNGSTVSYQSYSSPVYNTDDGSTYSEFTNRVKTENLGFLQIVKKADAYASEEFLKTPAYFKVELNGVQLKNTEDSTIQFVIEKIEGTDEIRSLNDQGYLVLYPNETATLTKRILSDTTFEVTEVNGAKTYVTYDVECTHPTGQVCPNENTDVNVSEHYFKENGDYDNNDDGGVSGRFMLANTITVIATNSSYKPGTLVNVEITKTVSGSMGDRAKEFTFEAYLSKDTADIAFPEADDDSYTVSGTVVATFSLAHGDSITIDKIPIGSIIYVRETNSTPYEVTVAGAVEVTIDDEVWYKAEVGTNGLKIDFTNTYDPVIDTAVHLDYLPYIILFAIVGTGVVLAASDKRREVDE